LFCFNPVKSNASFFQWNLVCDRQYLDSLANTIYFLGVFFGSLLIGPISDWWEKTAVACWH